MWCLQYTQKAKMAVLSFQGKLSEWSAVTCKMGILNPIQIPFKSSSDASGPLGEGKGEQLPQKFWEGLNHDPSRDYLITEP